MSLSHRENINDDDDDSTPRTKEHTRYSFVISKAIHSNIDDKRRNNDCLFHKNRFFALEIADVSIDGGARSTNPKTQTSFVLTARVHQMSVTSEHATQRARRPSQYRIEISSEIGIGAWCITSGLRSCRLE